MLSPRWSLLATFAAMPLLLAQQPQPKMPPGGAPVPWAVVSIHVVEPGKTDGYTGGDQPNGINDHGMSLKEIISQAYNFSVLPFRDDEMEGLPEWAKSTRYDLEARVGAEDVEAFRKISNLSMMESVAAMAARENTAEMLMEQAMLADRFHLKAHWEPRERTVYLLKVAKGGPRMQPAADPKHGSMNWSQGKLSGKGVPASFLSDLLASPAQRTVLNQTNLQGQYDFDLHFAPDNLSATGSTSTDPDLLTAVQEQLGLKLQISKQQVPVLVIDHIEQPTPN